MHTLVNNISSSFGLMVALIISIVIFAITCIAIFSYHRDEEKIEVRRCGD
jgi:hypothetical protein